MRVYAKVVEQGSFARASEVLDIPRPTATNAVAQLEKHLGVRLLHRTTRRLSLTDDGRHFYESCVRILEDLAETEESLSNASAAPRGRLRCSTPHSFIYQDFFHALPRFLADYPALEIEVILTDRQVNLVEEGIDCAVRAANIPDESTLIARHIAKVRWLTCASPGYLKRCGTPRTLADLDRHDRIRFMSPSSGRTVDWCFEQEGKRVDHVPRGRVGVTSMEGAVAAASAGLGIAHVSDVLALPDLRSGRLHPLLLEWAAPAPPVMIVYPSRRYLTARVKAFADFVAKVYPPTGAWPEIMAMAAKVGKSSR
jgi:LysR family transcriptional regulator for bpeEF and oprC